MMRKAKDKWEYGDFQTPQQLAEAAMVTLRRFRINPKTILEPTCGKGSFLLAAIHEFPEATRFIGVDINKQYLDGLEIKVSSLEQRDAIELLQSDFFFFDWRALFLDQPQPILIVGNPPWVTSSELGLLESNNLPPKNNFQERRGYDAITGKSNFDISEWMLLQYLAWLKNCRGVIAVLCKTAVARKVLCHAWKHHLAVSGANMFIIDAKKQFGASVDACFFVIDMRGGISSSDCIVFDDLSTEQPSQIIGYHDEIVLSNVGLYKRWRHIKGSDEAYTWRSGIKHDCSNVMELEPEGEKYRNGTGELISLEDDYVYPMLKSSDIGNGEIRYGRKYMLVTQKYVGEDTSPIKRIAPRTWGYLEANEERLEKRASSIYRNRPKYSIFGVGDYSFSEWKVAISGFYKRLSFKLIKPYQGKVVVLDDTTYFLPCWSESEAHFVENLLNSEPAQQFFKAMIFWADKRPITIEILKRLDLHALSIELGCEAEYLNYARHRKEKELEETRGQLSLGIV
ncbi:MAG: SAM-dependent DNA methyltransferase [Candidatus Latescibacter sp.]|nr:SAM-dependent DNA methyltransferase [Candidatus Latescibacter sp.]